jgi:hypothetical protein
MAKSKQEVIDDIVVRLVHALVEEHGPLVDRISVYPAHSGEYPYQVEVRNEHLPLAGLATDPDGNAIFTADQTPTSRKGSGTDGSSG